ncbi:phage tail tape measure protein [Shewanella xiamenensis]|uniref:phage tail tape measure protein n=1 Tax=Shewanella xiamenensis TaxID=332186 RepID=UPI0035B80596
MNKLQISVLLATVDKITGPLKKMRQAGGITATQLKETQERVKQLNKQSAQIDGYRKISRSLGITSNELAKAQKEAQRLALEMKNSQAPAKALVKEYEQAQAAVVKLKTQQKNLTISQHRQREELRASGIDTRNLSKHQRTLTADLAKANSQLDEQKRRLQQVSNQQKKLNAAQANYQKTKTLQGNLAGTGAGMVATGAAIGAASAVPIIEYSKAETAATDLRVAMMGAGGVVRKEFAEINALANQLGNKLPGTTADFQNMMTTLLKQGMTPKAILGGLGEASAFLAVQVKMPFNEAAEFAAKLQDATGTSEKDMMKLMDTIQRMDGLGVTTNNMSQSFSKMSSALPILRKTGLEAVELLSPLTVMADQASIAGEVAGNAYAKMFRLSMNKTKVAKANEMLEERGIKLDFTDGKGEFAGLDNMFKQLEKIKGLSTEDRLPILSQIFGDDGDTLTVLNLMTDKGIAGYRETAAKMKAQASLQLRVNEQLNTLTNLWDATTGTFSNALVNVGEAVAPELKQLVNWLGEMAEKLGTWVKANPELTGTLFKAAMAVGALAVAGGTLTLMLAGILGPLAMIKYSAEILGIKSLPLVGSAITKLGGAFSWILGGIKALTIALFTTPIGWLILGITALVAAGYLLVTHWDTVKAWMADFWQTIKSLAGEGIEAVKSYFNGLPEPLKAVLSSIWETMKTVFSWSPLGMIVNNFSEIISFFTGLPAKFSSLGEMTMDGLVKGITGKLTEVKEAITNAASNAIGWFKDVLGIASPSKVFATMGDQTMDGLTVGLNRSQQGPLNEVNKLSKQIAGTAFVLGISALPAAAMPSDVTNLPSPAPIVQHREIVEQLSPAKLSQPEDIVRQVRDEHSATALSAVPSANREIIEQLSPVKLSQPEDIVRQVRDEHSAAALSAVPNVNREIVEQLSPVKLSQPEDAVRQVRDEHSMVALSAVPSANRQIIEQLSSAKLSQPEDIVRQVRDEHSAAALSAVPNANREIIEQLSPAKLSQPEDIVRQVREQYLGTSLQAIPDQTRIIRDEYQGAAYLPNSSVPDAIRLVKEGELPARKPKDDDLSPDDNSLTHSTAPDRLSTFGQRQAPQPQTVHIDAGIHAPITVYATANMNAQDVAQLIAIELEKRERAQQARLRSSLKDLN